MAGVVVALVIEAYWLGAHGVDALSWRHHAVAVFWSAFAVTDFFATDITNQRLRARQFNVGDGGSALVLIAERRRSRRF